MARFDRMRAHALTGLLAIALALAACSSSTPTAGDGSPTAQPSPSEPPPPPPPPPPPAPLTGLPAASEEAAARPVLAVKIDNHVAARPHVGLDRADIVYEEPVEGGITRFVALYQSQGATVGPVRSARVADVEVLRDYGQVMLAFSGASRYVYGHLNRAKHLIQLEHGRYGSIYWRDRSRRAPHNLFTKTGSLFKAGRGKGATPAPRLFAFGELPEPPPIPTPRASASASPAASPAPLSEPAWPATKRARIPFSSESFTAVWNYDPALNLYLRLHGSRPHRAANGTRIAASNVIVMRLKTRPPGPTARNRTPEVVLDGSGPATLLRDGVRIEGRWSRPEGAEHTTFTDEQGRPFVLAPGRTWIELVPAGIRVGYV